MATLHVRNVPEDVYEALRARAKSEGRSINAETIAVSARGKKIGAPEARDVLRTTIALPLRTVPLALLSVPALERALAERISVYDACYLELAEAAGATLVTGDRRLARAARHHALL